MKSVVERVIEAAPALHNAGPLSPRVLRAIAGSCEGIELRHTAETGCGASTLLFSQLSQQHTVFAASQGNDSLANVRGSRLLRSEAVTFVEGPTQLTLPQYDFPYPLDCVLIDGPHGYPFPELEYYSFYPRLSVGALLMLDDIHIPTVHNLFRFLRADAMFELQSVVETTAIFRRTNAATFDPVGDGWWSQEFNRKVLLRYVWRDRVKGVLPRSLKTNVRRVRQRFSNGWGVTISIASPEPGQAVGANGLVTGVAKIPGDSQLWVLARRKDLPGWWLQGGGPLTVTDNHWRVDVSYGADRGLDFPFEICALAIRGGINEAWLDWTQRVAAGADCAPVELPPADSVITECRRTVYRKFN